MKKFITSTLMFLVELLIFIIAVLGSCILFCWAFGNNDGRVIIPIFVTYLVIYFMWSAGEFARDKDY